MTETEAFITPLVRRLAEERGADLSKIKGTGIGGRIRRQDVITATPNYKDPYDDTQPVWDIQELLFGSEEPTVNTDPETRTAEEYLVTQFREYRNRARKAEGQVKRIETFASMLDEGGNPLFAEMLRVILED